LKNAAQKNRLDTINIDDTQHKSSTWKEILSQGEVWQTVIDALRDSSLPKDILQKSVNKREWLFVGCGTSFYLGEAAALS